MRNCKPENTKVDVKKKFFKNNESTDWEITWAMAAPLTPKRQANMRIGSKMIFVTSPATE